MTLRASEMASLREAVALSGMTIESCGEITREGWTNAVQAKKDFLGYSRADQLAIFPLSASNLQIAPF